jgi:hypothetical protein
MRVKNSTCRVRKTPQRVKFFESIGIHPNQIVSKNFIEASGLLVQTHDNILYGSLNKLDLAKKLGIIKQPAVLWLRNRLGRLIWEHDRNGKSYTTKQIIQSLGRDPKLQRVLKALKAETVVDDSDNPDEEYDFISNYGDNSLSKLSRNQ